MSLLDELGAADCWCGRDPTECDEAGGCRFTREIAAIASARDGEIRHLTEELRGARLAVERAEVLLAERDRQWAEALRENERLRAKLTALEGDSDE